MVGLRMHHLGLVVTVCLLNIRISFATECGPMDLVLLLDASRSIGSDNWPTVTEFAKHLVSKFDIDSGATRVGLAIFSFKGSIGFFLNKYSDKRAVLNDLEHTTYTKLGTNTQAGLRIVREQMFQINKGDRENVPNIVVVFTDGKSNIEVEQTIPEAQKLQNASKCVICVAVGSNMNEDELKAIASDPDYEHLIELNDFSGLNSAVDRIVEAACKQTEIEVSTIPETTSTQKLTSDWEYLSITKRTSTQQAEPVSTIDLNSLQSSSETLETKQTEAVDPKILSPTTEIDISTRGHPRTPTSPPVHLYSGITNTESTDKNAIDNSPEVLCTTPPELRNAVTRGCSRHIGAEASITCSKGHMFPDGQKVKAVRCNSMGVWEPKTGQCIGNTGTKVAACDGGYEIREDDNGKTKTCSSSMELQRNPKCKRRICSPLPDKDHATPGTYGILYYMDRVPYFCNDGHMTKKKRQEFWATCSEWGEWIFDSDSECLRILCPVIPTWLDMKVNSTDNYYRTTVNYTCDEGYYFADRWRYRYTSCGRDGRWNPDIVKCVENDTLKEKETPAEAPFAHLYGLTAVGVLAAVVLFFFCLDCLYYLDVNQRGNEISP